MTFSDTTLLVRKILLGFVITVVPLAIVAGGLRLIQRGVAGGEKQTRSAKVAQHAN